MAASKLEITGSRDERGTHIQIAFPHGPKREFLLSKDHPLYDDFAAHGFAKKVRDQIGGPVGTAEAVAEVDALLAAFGKGDWNVQRNTEGGPSVGYLAQALMRLYSSSEEQAQSYIKGLTKKQQSDLREEPRVAAAIAEIKAEEKAKKGEGDAGNLLAGFGSLVGREQGEEDFQGGQELAPQEDPLNA